MSKKDTLLFKSAGQSKRTFKPSGLWYGIGQEWINWVEIEMSQWMGEHLFKLDINTSRVLVLNTKKKVLEFNHTYGIDKSNRLMSYIDWRKAAAKYSGIEFNPYFYDLRRDLLWYSTIDVPSGCVWKSDALRKVVKIK